MPTIFVNGVSIAYPDVGDSNWGTDATNFAIQVAAALGKIGQSAIPPTNDITVSPGNLSVTSGNLSVGGNSNLGNDTSDTTAITGILNVDSGVLYVDPTNNRVGINDATPSVELDVNGSVAITGNETVGGVIYADDNTTANTPVISFTGDTNTGIGRSAADTLDFITNGNSRFRIESTGQIKAVYESEVGTDYNTRLDNGYLCRAWVNFNGTGTVAIRASGNVSSIIDNNTGDYTINFTTAMPDPNYVVTGMTEGFSTANASISELGINPAASSVLANSVRLINHRSNGSDIDLPFCLVAVFR